MCKSVNGSKRKPIRSPLSDQGHVRRRVLYQYRRVQMYVTGRTGQFQRGGGSKAAVGRGGGSKAAVGRGAGQKRQWEGGLVKSGSGHVQARDLADKAVRRHPGKHAFLAFSSRFRVVATQSSVGGHATATICHTVTKHLQRRIARGRTPSPSRHPTPAGGLSTWSCWSCNQ